MTVRACKKCTPYYNHKSRKCNRTGESRSPWDGMCSVGEELFTTSVDAQVQSLAGGRK